MSTKFDASTVEGKMQQILYSHGLFEDEAKAVVDRVKASPASEAMTGRWNDRADAYPEPLFRVLMIAARQEAAAWIDENKPGHWARGMFVDEKPSDPTNAFLQALGSALQSTPKG